MIDLPLIDKHAAECVEELLESAAVNSGQAWFPIIQKRMVKLLYDHERTAEELRGICARLARTIKMRTKPKTKPCKKQIVYGHGPGP